MFNIPFGTKERDGVRGFGGGEGGEKGKRALLNRMTQGKPSKCSNSGLQQRVGDTP